MNIKKAIVTGVETSVAIPSVFVGTCFGTMFAPSLATAAGGAPAVISAAAAGLQIAFLPTVFFSSLAALTNKPTLKAGFSVLAAASFIGGVTLGGAMFGLSAQTLMPCIGLGVAIGALGAMAIIGLAKVCLNALLDEFNQTYFSPSL